MRIFEHSIHLIITIKVAMTDDAIDNFSVIRHVWLCAINNEISQNMCTVAYITYHQLVLFHIKQWMKKQFMHGSSNVYEREGTEIGVSQGGYREKRRNFGLLA